MIKELQFNDFKLGKEFMLAAISDESTRSGVGGPAAVSALSR